MYLGGLSQPAEVLGKYLASSVPKEAFASLHPSASYEVALDVTTTNGPILAITVDDTSPGGAQGALTSVLSSIPAGLATLEQSASVPDGSSIATMTLARDSQSTPITKDTVRAVGAVGAAGAVGVALLVGAADTILARMRRRRRATESNDDASGTSNHETDTGGPGNSSVVGLGPGRRASRLRPTGTDDIEAGSEIANPLHRGRHQHRNLS